MADSQIFSIILFFFITELRSKPPHNPGFPKERVNKNFQILTVLIRGEVVELKKPNSYLSDWMGAIGAKYRTNNFFKALLVSTVI